MGLGGTIDYTVSATLKIRDLMLNRYDDLTLELHLQGITKCSNTAVSFAYSLPIRNPQF